MVNTIVVDPDGDLTLRVGNDDTTNGEKDTESKVLELTISSKILTLVSPVFKVMLTGQFKEAIELAEWKPSSRLYILELPDDDPEATSILTKILHHKTHEITQNPSPSCLEQLAFLCDKYKCTGALKYAGGIWLRDWLAAEPGKEPAVDDLCRLLIFAYVSDLAQEFSDIAWKLFMYHKGPFLGDYTQAVVLVDHPLLGHGVMGRAC